MAKLARDGNPKDYDYLLESGYDFQLEAYIKRGWEIFEKNIAGFLIYSFLFLLFSALILIPLLDLYLWGNCIDTGLSYIFLSGMLIVARKVAREESYSFGDFFKGFNQFLQLFIAGFLFCLFSILGIILLVIPSIYLVVAYCMTVPLIVFGKLKAWPAMEVSRKIVTENWWEFFKLSLIIALGLIIILALFIIPSEFLNADNFIGKVLFISSFVSALIFIPLISCVQYAVYEDIFDHSYEDRLLDEIGSNVANEGDMNAGNY